MKKENKTKTTILVLAFLLVLAAGYIVVGTYQQNKQQEQLTIFQQGARYGYEMAVSQIMQQVSTCRAVPIFVQNQTINLIAMECLQQNVDEEFDLAG